MEFDFLSPVEDEIIQFATSLSSQNLGRKIAFHTAKDFPDISKIKLAIIGVIENRGDIHAYEDVNLSTVRKEIYALFPGNWHSSIADLGDILPGNSLEDTFFAVQRVVSRLLKNSVLPIIIGGSQDLTYAIYRAYDDLEQMVNLVSIDAKFDFGKQEDGITSNSYISKIVLDEPNNLFNFCNIGYQTYLNSQEEIDLIEKLYFDAYRLGEISNNIALAEPVLRDADMVSLDLTAIQSAFSGNSTNFMPNGFDGKEICSLARYAGISDKISSFAILNTHSNTKEPVIIAQIIWYFIEGYNLRSKDYPFGTKENYSKYIVPLEDQEIVFYKSNKTERWWMEVNFFNQAHNKLNKLSLLPCSHEEYLSACNNEIPERWWKAQRKSFV
jgi:arginase family enzyme